MNKNYEIDEFDTILPFRNQYKYTHLEQYEEHELLEMFSIELVLRYIEFHNTLIQEKTYFQMESETDEEFERRLDLEEFNLTKKVDAKLFKNFGLDTYEMSSLLLMHPYHGYSEDNITTRYYIKQPNILNIDLDLAKPLKELIATIEKHKKEYDDNNSNAINLLNKINEAYSNKIKEAFSEFKGTFAEQKKIMIDALFTFDYVEARDKEVKRLNEETQSDYKKNLLKIADNYKKGFINEEDKKQSEVDALNEQNELIIDKPTLNTSRENCYFKEELFSFSKIPPGTAKKNYYKIKDLITNSIF